MKTGSIIITILIIALVGVLVFSAKKPTGNVIKEDVFEGVITNMKLEPQVLDGFGVYDRSCNMISGGLTNCDAGIQTEKGLLNFNYKHDMVAQPCIDEGQKLKVEILEGDKARVTRL